MDLTSVHPKGLPICCSKGIFRPISMCGKILCEDIAIQMALTLDNFSKESIKNDFERFLFKTKQGLSWLTGSPVLPWKREG